MSETEEQLQSQLLASEARTQRLLTVLDRLLVDLEPVRAMAQNGVDKACEDRRAQADRDNAVASHSSQVWTYMTEFRRGLEADIVTFNRTTKDANEVFEAVRKETPRGKNELTELRRFRDRVASLVGMAKPEVDPAGIDLSLIVDDLHTREETSERDARHKILLGDALRDVLVKDGVLRDDAGPTGPELLLAAQTYLGGAS